jgi:hypothetical protein
MAPADSLSPPGSSSYSSDTLTVGDGTWDFTKNTFLLPNLVGLNYETMRFNGMRPGSPRDRSTTNTWTQAWATALRR